MANNSSRYYAKAIEFGILLAVFVTPLILLFDLPYGYLGHQIVTLLHVQDPTHWITPGALIIKTVFFDLVVLVLFALWIMECATANRLVFVRAPLDWPLAAFLFWNLISVFWSKYDYATLTQAGKYVTYSFLYWMVVAHIREPRQIRRLLWTIFLSVTVTCVYGIAQFLGHDFFFWYPQDPRIMSSLGNATFYAAHLILLLPLALNLFLAGGWPQALPGKPELPAGGTPVLPWRRTAGVVALGVLVALMYFCLLATYTRAAWLALLVVTVLDLGLLARYAGWLRAPRRRTVLSAAGLAVLLAAVTALMAVEGSYSLSQRLASSFKVDMSNVQRIMAWKAAYQEFRTHPLLGTGSGTFFDHVAGYLDPEFYNTGDAAWIEHAHNEILEQAAETGIVGVGLFLWLIVAFAGMALRVTRRAADPLARYLAPALLCGALAFLGQNLAGVSLRYTTGAAYLWLVMGLVAVLIPTSASLEPALEVRRGPSVGRQVLLAVLLLGLVGIVGQQILDRLISDIYLEKGMLAQGQSDWPAAYSALEESLTRNSYSLRSYAILGAVAVAAGNYDTALSAFQTLQALDAEYPKLYRGLGDTYKGLRRRQEELAAYQEDARLEHSSTTLLNLAQGYADMGQMDQALKAADEAVEIVVQGRPWPHMPAAEVYFRRAQLRATAGQRAGAVDDIRKAEQLDPTSDKPHMIMGDIYRGWHEYEQAIAEYNRAQELNPQGAEAYLFRGMSHAELHQFAAAAADYRSALFIQPDNALTELNLGLVLRQLGDYAEARQHMQTVAALGPKNPLAAKAQAELAATPDVPAPPGSQP